MIELDTVEIARTAIANSGFDRDRDLDESNLSQGGPLWMSVTERARLVSVSITGGGFTSAGGAVAFVSTAAFEIVNCVFEGNSAIADGGAVFFAGSGSLFVQDSIFLNNRAERQTPILQQIVVNLFTGGTGVGSTLAPVWKLDGASPDLDTGHCGSETVYGNSTYHQRYERGQLYSEVLTTTTGEHTLWFGAEVFKPSPFNGWDGGGWISILGTVTKMFPALCDNRGRSDCPAPNDFARDPGCYGAENPQALDLDLRFCVLGQAFWSSLSFEVPAGTGGAIAAVGTGTVTIKDSRFGSNQAGFGNAVAATGSDGLTVQGTTFDDVTPNTFSLEGVEAADCRQHPCAVGERCTIARLSLHCEPCPNGQIGLDGIDCLMCEPGKQHNANHTACMECAHGKHSSATTAGVCEPCASGTQPGINRDTCTECTAGYFSTFGDACIQCSGSHFSVASAAFCMECPAGQSSEGHIICESCPSGKARPQGQPECFPCSAGMEPDAVGEGCTACAEPSGYSQSGQLCAPCGPGTQPFVNRSGCEACPPGQAGVDGTCALCQTGRYAESAITCSSCDAGMEPTEDKSRCHCKVGTYDSSALGLIVCDGAVGPASSATRGSCTECPPCIDCSTRGVVKLKEGWASFGGGTTVFTCPYLPACPQRTLNESSLNDQVCARGYDPEAPLCAMCAAEYNAYKVGLVCDPCNNVTINIPLLIGLLACGFMVVASIVSGAYAWLVDNAMMTDLRIILGTFQILAQADTVCKSFTASIPPSSRRCNHKTMLALTRRVCVRCAVPQCASPFLRQCRS
jgi:hypothetical protein